MNLIVKYVLPQTDVWGSFFMGVLLLPGNIQVRRNKRSFAYWYGLFRKSESLNSEIIRLAQIKKHKVAIIAITRFSIYN